MYYALIEHLNDLRTSSTVIVSQIASLIISSAGTLTLRSKCSNDTLRSKLIRYTSLLFCHRTKSLIELHLNINMSNTQTPRLEDRQRSMLALQNQAVKILEQIWVMVTTSTFTVSTYKDGWRELFTDTYIQAGRKEQITDSFVGVKNLFEISLCFYLASVLLIINK